MRYSTSPLKKFIIDVSAKTPAPGGGSVAALGGACGVSLLGMVIRYTVGKEKYSRYKKELTYALRISEQFQQKLTELIDRDVIVYRKVSVASRSKNESAKQKALQQATLIPLEIARYCCQAIMLCEKIVNKTNRYLVGDLLSALYFLDAALQSALTNVRNNLKRVTDKHFVREHQRYIAKQVRQCARVKQKVILGAQQRL